MKFSLQVREVTPAALQPSVRQAEDAGFDAVHVSDHPGVSASPFVVLASIAAMTTHIRLGTYVLNTGVHHPVDVANAVITLDVVSGGRAVLGLGAGHTPAEWTSRGLKAPTPAARVDRLEAFVEIVQALIRGETVTTDADSVIPVQDAVIVEPRPLQASIPLLIGGNGGRVLSLASRVADMVSVTGLGATTSDGHRHLPMWTQAEIDRSFARIESSSTVKRDVLVQHLEITNNRASSLQTFATMAQVDVDLLDDIPFVLVGTRDHILDQMERNRTRWGIESYTVRESGLEAAEQLIAS
jgi:probable F420-dependent oxidoreductase